MTGPWWMQAWQGLTIEQMLAQLPNDTARLRFMRDMFEMAREANIELSKKLMKFREKEIDEMIAALAATTETQPQCDEHSAGDAALPGCGIVGLGGGR